MTHAITSTMSPELYRSESGLPSFGIEFVLSAILLAIVTLSLQIIACMPPPADDVPLICEMAR